MHISTLVCSMMIKYQQIQQDGSFLQQLMASALFGYVSPCNAASARNIHSLILDPQSMHYVQTYCSSAISAVNQQYTMGANPAMVQYTIAALQSQRRPNMVGQKQVALFKFKTNRIGTISTSQPSTAPPPQEE